MRKLLYTQQPDNYKLLLAIFHYWFTQFPNLRWALYLAGSDKRILSNENSEEWQVENSFQNAVKSF